MKERPILFSAPMVQAILEGRKTQTRRIVKPQPLSGEKGQMVDLGGAYALLDGILAGEWKCPYGKVGDRLWVREAWRAHRNDNHKPPRDITEWIIHEADNKPHLKQGKLRPSIFMPRWASRLTLEIVDVRVERLNDISEVDAIAEGLQVENGIVAAECIGGIHTERMSDIYFNGVEGNAEEGSDCPIERFADLWEHVNGEGAWDENPWVWVVEFKKVETLSIDFGG